MRHPERPDEMEHVDEGTIHAWMDGALSADDAARAEAHLAVCAECSAAAAEARGLAAAASRILSALDGVPAGVIPVAPRAEAPVPAPTPPPLPIARPRPWWRAPHMPYLQAAAVALVAAGTIGVLTLGRIPGGTSVAARDQVTLARETGSHGPRAEGASEGVTVAPPSMTADEVAALDKPAAAPARSAANVADGKRDVAATTPAFRNAVATAQSAQPAEPKALTDVRANASRRAVADIAIPVLRAERDAAAAARIAGASVAAAPAVPALRPAPPSVAGATGAVMVGKAMQARQSRETQQGFASGDRAKLELEARSTVREMVSGVAAGAAAGDVAGCYDLTVALLRQADPRSAARSGADAARPLATLPRQIVLDTARLPGGGHLARALTAANGPGPTGTWASSGARALLVRFPGDSISVSVERAGEGDGDTWRGLVTVAGTAAAPRWTSEVTMRRAAACPAPGR